jgi:hypothetical protein
MGMQSSSESSVLQTDVQQRQSYGEAPPVWRRKVMLDQPIRSRGALLAAPGGLWTGLFLDALSRVRLLGAQIQYTLHVATATTTTIQPVLSLLDLSLACSYEPTSSSMRLLYTESDGGFEWTKEY